MQPKEWVHNCRKEKQLDEHQFNIFFHLVQAQVQLEDIQVKRDYLTNWCILSNVWRLAYPLGSRILIFLTDTLCFHQLLHPQEKNEKQSWQLIIDISPMSVNSYKENYWVKKKCNHEQINSNHINISHCKKC